MDMGEGRGGGGGTERDRGAGVLRRLMLMPNHPRR